jgi:CTP:molybdopterin cytidylyltransferase MocA
MRQTPCKEVAGVILAAGEGKRFGQPKATAQIDGVTFLEKIAKILKDVGCRPIIAVGGSDTGMIIQEATRLEIGYIINKDWEKGQFSSLKTGLASLKQEVCGALITLVDHPFVVPETYKLLKDAFTKSPKRIIIPVYDHRRGHPIVLPRDIMREIAESPDTGNLKDIINNHERMVVQHRCEDPAVLQDIDTRDDLERALKQ